MRTIKASEWMVTSDGRVVRKPKKAGQVTKRVARGAAPQTKTLSQYEANNVRVGGLLGIEKKFKDYVKANVDLSDVWACCDPTVGGGNDVTIVTIGQGAGASEREGRNATLTNLSIYGQLYAALNNTAVASIVPQGFVRILVVLDSQNNATATAPTIDNILSVTNSSATTNLPALGFNNISNSKRFRILKDKRIPIPTVGINASADNANSVILPQLVNFQIHKKLPSIKQSYKSSEVLSANITDYNVHIYAVVSSVGIPVKLAYQSRLRFYG